MAIAPFDFGFIELVFARTKAVEAICVVFVPYGAVGTVLVPVKTLFKFKIATLLVTLLVSMPSVPLYLQKVIFGGYLASFVGNPLSPVNTSTPASVSKTHG